MNAGLPAGLWNAEPVALPAGELLLTSGDLVNGQLPTDTTAWLRV